MKFPEKTALTGFTEELYCGSHDENEAVHADVHVCEKYAVSFNFYRFFRCPFLSPSILRKVLREPKKRSISKEM